MAYNSHLIFSSHKVYSIYIGCTSFLNKTRILPMALPILGHINYYYYYLKPFWFICVVCFVTHYSNNFYFETGTKIQLAIQDSCVFYDYHVCTLRNYLQHIYINLILKLRWTNEKRPYSYTKILVNPNNSKDHIQYIDRTLFAFLP